MLKSGLFRARSGQRLRHSPVCSNQCGDESRRKQMRLYSRATLSVCEFIVDQSAQMISYRLMIEPLNHFVQKSADDEALRDWNGNAASTQVKKLVFVDLA